MRWRVTGLIVVFGVMMLSRSPLLLADGTSPEPCPTWLPAPTIKVDGIRFSGLTLHLEYRTASNGGYYSTRPDVPKSDDGYWSWMDAHCATFNKNDNRF